MTTEIEFIEIKKTNKQNMKELLERFKGMIFSKSCCYRYIRPRENATNNLTWGTNGYVDSVTYGISYWNKWYLER